MFKLASHLRPGMTYRVYDFHRYIGCAGTRVFAARHRISIPLPRFAFRRAYQLRHVGGLQVYRLTSRATRALCAAPRREVTPS